ncbi:MAG: ribbon-helix-helix protein, CopG family [bacterium]
MKKTTLYIRDDLVRKLKEETIREDRSMTDIINEALRKHLENKGKTSEKFENLKRALGKSAAFRKVSDPVEYQRKLRSEWE